MTTIQRLGLLLAIGAFAWPLGIACGDDGDEKAADSRASTVVAAPIDDLELVIRESFPPQYALRVVSGLPNGCHEFNGHELTRDGMNITIRVTNRVPTDPTIACIQVYGQHEEVTVTLPPKMSPPSMLLVQVASGVTEPCFLSTAAPSPAPVACTPGRCGD